jgi:hypothetical protein
MSKYEPELRHRLANKEPIAATARWFAQCVQGDRFGVVSNGVVDGE